MKNADQQFLMWLTHSVSDGCKLHRCFESCWSFLLPHGSIEDTFFLSTKNYQCYLQVANDSLLLPNANYASISRCARYRRFPMAENSVQFSAYSLCLGSLLSQQRLRGKRAGAAFVFGCCASSLVRPWRLSSRNKLYTGIQRNKSAVCGTILFSATLSATLVARCLQHLWHWQSTWTLPAWHGEALLLCTMLHMICCWENILHIIDHCSI